MEPANGTADCDIVLVGGGHSHVEVIRRFAMRRPTGLRLTVIARDIDTPYSGMVPGYLAGHYSHDDCHVDLGPLCAFAGARLYHASATGLDLDDHRVHCTNRPPVRFDLLSLDTGAVPTHATIPGAAEHAIPVKPIDGLLASIHGIERSLSSARQAFRIVVVGAGAGGIELTLALQQRLLAQVDDPQRLALTVIDDAAAILPTHPPAVRRRLARTLARRNITVRTSTRAHSFVARVLHTSGADIPFDAAILVTEAAAPRWLANTGLELDENGFVRVDTALRSVSHGQVFATGDVAALAGHNLPKAGVYAVRQGPVLAENLRRCAARQPLAHYRPQRRILALISTGDRYAIASRGRLTTTGKWVWHWKDRIDRRWMDRYRNFPPMSPQATTPPPAPRADEDMRCGGCGAKIPAPVLRRALARLDIAPRPDIPIGLATGDDAAVIAPPPGTVMVQSIDHFRAFIDNPYLLGHIAANHCLNDLYAMGATPQAALATVTLPRDTAEQQADDLYDLLAGAAAVLEEAGASLAGGHTAEGAELAFGLSVSGFAKPAELVRKAGLRPGDALILTKPLGTGALFAAHMRHRARGRWIAMALASMRQSNRRAATLLAQHGMRAATDVTGFGLAGHLLEMLQASAVDVQLDPASLPALPGARELIAQGIASSLHPDNVAANAQHIRSRRTSAPDPLLFDPQTAGGLLAGVPSAAAPRCLTALQDAGYGDAVIIGRVVPRHGESPEITLS